MALTFVARWFVRPDKKAEFIAAVEELTTAISPELMPTNDYIRLFWNRRGEFIACESWKDNAGIDAFRRSEPFHRAMRKMSACSHRPLELEVLDALDGDGEPFTLYPEGRADPTMYPDLGAMTAKWV